MSLLSVVQDVCAVVGVAQPTTVFTNLSGNRTMQEMVALANEMAQRISYDTRDWTRLKLTATYLGDGSTQAFPVPADYKRMLLNSNVWLSTNAIQPMRFILDADEWMNRRALNYLSPWGEWTMMGGNILIVPTMAAGVNAYHAYLQKNCISLTSGGFGDRFIADTDSFVLDERVLRLGMVWQWKAQKGSPYQEDLGTYGDALTNAMGHDSPAPIIIDRRPISLAVKTAYPWPVPTP